MADNGKLFRAVLRVGYYNKQTPRLAVSTAVGRERVHVMVENLFHGTFFSGQGSCSRNFHLLFKLVQKITKMFQIRSKSVPNPFQIRSKSVP